MFELTLDDQSTVTLIPVTTYEPTCIDGSLSHEWLAADRETSSNNQHSRPLLRLLPLRHHNGCGSCGHLYGTRPFYKGDIAIDLDIDPEDVYIA